MSEQIFFTDLYETPSLRIKSDEFLSGMWPVFMNKSKVGADSWPVITTGILAKYQMVAFTDDPDRGVNIIGMASATPMPDIDPDKILDFLPGCGWDEIISQGARHAAGLIDDVEYVQPPVMGALCVTVDKNHRGSGLAVQLIKRMCSQAKQAGSRALLVPLRPTMRSQYPLQSFEEYCGWRRGDGLPFDPWLRTHIRLGARILGVAQHSSVIEGTRTDWENWTGLRFPRGGGYWIPGGLAPLMIDMEKERGRYAEPNLWVVHDLS